MIHSTHNIIRVTRVKSNHNLNHVQHKYKGKKQHILTWVRPLLVAHRNSSLNWIDLYHVKKTKKQKNIFHRYKWKIAAWLIGIFLWSRTSRPFYCRTERTPDFWATEVETQPTQQRLHNGIKESFCFTSSSLRALQNSDVLPRSPLVRVYCKCRVQTIKGFWKIFFTLGQPSLSVQLVLVLSTLTKHSCFWREFKLAP